MAILAAVACVLAAAGLATDLRSRRIPNWLTLPGMAAGFILQAALFGAQGAVASLEGWLFGLAVLVLPFVKGGMGGGDVKLLAAIGSILGFHPMVYAALYTALAGGILAVWAAWRNGVWNVVLHGMWMPGMKSGVYVPYAVAIFAGTLAGSVRVLL
jgi:prepilin peptidase CpaA